ncbi:hypothetical protein CH63R_13877 [Colletotrichum higginsianum IMI 349063]|uniref:Uncharacterized protein n=1 Tax=Colletotrichum higginsianum (strain IMI 349063) TaxID=759273 RepID=A0A1B7XSB6_COLHI|nr:hypothetical protein CH63R_13877 [Colletotrichum higginsianum IMI 349063]OBR02651.1 hypothetical protein CH63R_13877 [Colletotrichum higginsianum IMI 349063]
MMLASTVSTSYRDNCLPEENSLQHKIPNRSAVAGFTPAGLKMKMTRAPVSVIFDFVAAIFPKSRLWSTFVQSHTYSDNVVQLAPYLLGRTDESPADVCSSPRCSSLSWDPSCALWLRTPSSSSSAEQSQEWAQ